MIYYFDKRPILIVGASGLIGSELYKQYVKEGHSVKILTTNKKVAKSKDYAYYWNVEEGIIDEKAFDGIEVLVNLAGANVAKGYWTKERKKLIYESRVHGTRLLFETCQKIGKRLKFYMGASAVGFYGPVNDYIPRTEEDPKGEGFLAEVCADWEREHKKFEPTTTHFVISRLPVVFSGKGGFLTPFLILSRFGFRIYFSRHDKMLSWIHIEDVVRFYSAVLFMDIEGTFNVCVGDKLWYKLQEYIYDKFGDQIIRFTIPRFLIKLAMGEMSTLMIDGNYVSGMKLESTGFMIKHVELYIAMREVADELKEIKKIKEFK